MGRSASTTWIKHHHFENLTKNYFYKNWEIPCKTDCLAGAQNLQTFSYNLHKIIILAAKHLAIP
jgi:hypothetical protein